MTQSKLFDPTLGTCRFDNWDSIFDGLWEYLMDYETLYWKLVILIELWNYLLELTSVPVFSLLVGRQSCSGGRP